MKQYDNDFLNLLGHCAPDVPPMTKQELQQLYKSAMSRQGARGRFPRKNRNLLLAAAAAAALLAAAAYGNVSDAFREVLREQDSAGRSTPLSSMAPLVDRSGTLIGETVRNQSLEVTVRGVVGDASSFQILLDVVDPTGQTLALEQADGTLSQEMLRFGSIRIRTDETRGNTRDSRIASPYDYDFGQAVTGMSGSDNSLHPPSGNRVTMLVSVNLDTTEALVGQTLYLTLRDLKQIAVLHGEPVGMKSDDLHRLVSQFEPVTDVDLQATGAMQHYETGVTTYSYELVTDSEKSFPLAPGLSQYAVTNAAVHNGHVYLRGTAPLPAPGDALFDNLQLWNPQTNTYLPFALGGQSDSDSGTIIWTLSFAGVETLEDLRGFVLLQNAGQGLHLLREGEWEFTVPLNFENTTRQFHPNQSFAVADYSMAARELTISPYYVSMKTSIDEAVYERMMFRETPISVDWHPIVTGQTEWDKVQQDAIITMKNGTQLRLPMGGGGGSPDNFTIHFALDVVIDPEEVESFAFGNLAVSVS